MSAPELHFLFFKASIVFCHTRRSLFNNDRIILIVLMATQNKSNGENQQTKFCRQKQSKQTATAAIGQSENSFLFRLRYFKFEALFHLFVNSRRPIDSIIHMTPGSIKSILLMKIDFNRNCITNHNQKRLTRNF